MYVACVCAHVRVCACARVRVRVCARAGVRVSGLGVIRETAGLVMVIIFLASRRGRVVGARVCLYGTIPWLLRRLTSNHSLALYVTDKKIDSTTIVDG